MCVSVPQVMTTSAGQHNWSSHMRMTVTMSPGLLTLSLSWVRTARTAEAAIARCCVPLATACVCELRPEPSPV